MSDKRTIYLPHNELSDKKRQYSYNEALKKRAIKKCDERLAELEDRNRKLAEEIAIMEQTASPVAKEAN
jgi:hypothetical protein